VLEKKTRAALLEKKLAEDPSLDEATKDAVRGALEREEGLIAMDRRKKTTKDDFESLAVIGRGAFGEVRLVRTTAKEVRQSEERSDELTTQSQTAKTAHLHNSVQDAPFPKPPRKCSFIIPTLFTIRFAHRRVVMSKFSPSRV